MARQLGYILMRLLGRIDSEIRRIRLAEQLVGLGVLGMFRGE